MTRRSCAIYAVGIICSSLLVLGIGLIVSQVFRTMMNNRLKKEIVLVEGSRVFESWKRPPPPVFTQYYFFNVTNVDAFLAGEKPRVTEVGPYTYRQYRTRENVSMLENGAKVSAYNTKSFVFLRDKSVGDPAEDRITTVNIPAWAVMNKLKNSFWKASMMSVWMNSIGSGLFTTLTVDELLWGYEDPVLARLASTSPDIDKIFGLMVKKNGTHTGEFVYHSGQENYLDFGRVVTWQGQSQLTFWTSNQSNSINGSDGAIHPLLEKNERLYVFTPDLCRSIYMEFEKDVEVKGIPAYRFTPPRSVFASKEENPANEGFCVSPQECLGTGVLNVSPCRKGTSGFSFGSFGAKTTASSTFGFGAPATTTTASSGFGTFTAPSFGTTTSTAAAAPTGFSFGSTTAGTFGGFGTATTSAAAPAGSSFSFAAPSSTTGSLFGNTQNKGFGFSSGLGTGATAGTSAFGTGLGTTGLGGFGGFNIQPTQQQQGGLFGQQAPQPGQTQHTQLYQQVTALSAPTLLGDERDTILAKWNQLQAYWGTGKGYYANNNPPVDFTQENPFCRFKAVGYSCIPVAKDEDGLVALVLNKKEADVRAQQQQLVESLQKILGSNQMLSVNVDGVKSLPDDQTEVIVYVVERSPNGTSKRIPATTLFSFLEQANIKLQLTQLGVTMSIARTELSPAQLKQLLQNAPAGVDPIIWEQAKVDNPDPEKLIPVPMVGFKELLRRLQIQEQMTKQHQTRVDIISNDISELQKNQATTVAKIAQYKRNLMDLSHRVLQVLIKQEIQRKSGYAIQVDEEHLRVQLDTIQSELNAPTQFKGRLNELMSQIRMQNHFGAVRSEERYSVDADLLREIKQHLKQQQEGLSHLISVIKDDLEDIKLVEHGLSDSGHIRGGI